MEILPLIFILRKEANNMVAYPNWENFKWFKTILILLNYESKLCNGKIC
jgi:hypothetical protein